LPGSLKRGERGQNFRCSLAAFEVSSWVSKCGPKGLSGFAHGRGVYKVLKKLKKIE